MKYAHVIGAALSQPWAILDAKFDAIVSVLARCEAGEKLTEDEIRERVGEKKTVAEPFCITEDGVRQEFGLAAASAGKSSSGPKGVAVLPVFGIIAPRVASLDISETGTGIDALTSQFRAAMANPNIKAIVMDFDSPGGSVYGVDELAAEIFAARDQKKIVAQVDPFCASAAYYLASQCSEIAMTPSGEVGSIGVRVMHQDISKALDMKGIKLTNIFAGKYKTEGNPAEPLSEDGMAYWQQRVDDYYGMFVSAVARGRDVKATEVKNGFGEGRMVGATQAKRLGMIDRVATLDETLARLGVSADGGRVPVSAAETSNAVTATAETKEAEMATTITPGAAAAAINQDERDRCAKISRLVAMHKIDPALMTQWMADGASVETVQEAILGGLAKKATPVSTVEFAENGNRITVVADEADRLPKSLRVGRFMRAVAASRGDRGRAIAFSRNVLRDPSTTSHFEATANPQDASSLSGGGFIVPENLQMDIIEYLRPNAVVRSLKPATAPLVGGTLSLPKITGGAVASYVGENKAITPTKVTGGQIKATAKKLAALVPISNDLLRYAGTAADEMVRNDCMRAIAQVEDLSFIRGAGTAYSPKGLRNWCLSANLVNANQTVSVANTIADLGKLWTLLANSNVRFINPGFIFAPRTYQ